MTDPVITEDELRAEYARIDELRRPQPTSLMTDEQFQIMHYGRTGNKTVSWTQLSAYWKSRGWGEIRPGTLMYRYKSECVRRGITDCYPS